MADSFTRAPLETLNNETEPLGDGVEVSEGKWTPAGQDVEKSSSEPVPEVEIKRPENGFAATIRTFVAKVRSSR